MLLNLRTLGKISVYKMQHVMECRLSALILFSMYSELPLPHIWSRIDQHFVGIHFYFYFASPPQFTGPISRNGSVEMSCPCEFSPESSVKLSRLATPFNLFISHNSPFALEENQ